MYITRRERFSSAHKLLNGKFSQKENKNIFGKCYELHGHNYELFVTVTGKINPQNGMIIDLKELKKIIKDKVTSKIDHNFINDVSFMKDMVTTTENLCIQIWKELSEPIETLGAKLYKIKINETENNSFEYYGE
tara:strand:+ start:17963 stop:18364 length:402 start_codon:yes stop_codon:yes gene_type:complete